MDPNFKRISSLGFKDIPSTACLDAIETFMEKFPKFPNYRADHEFPGKHGEQVMKNASFVEFPSPDVAKNFLKEVEAKKGTAEFPIAGVTVKRALSKVNRQRNYALRKAEEVINAKFPRKQSSSITRSAPSASTAQSSSSRRRTNLRGRSPAAWRVHACRRDVGGSHFSPHLANMWNSEALMAQSP